MYASNLIPPYQEKDPPVPIRLRIKCEIDINLDK